ncbi:MAG TPA: hypothetical protein VK466_02855 [Terriglobales bacterium]|nr:hypothetical protein [Terriglobales bacterium]
MATQPQAAMESRSDAVVEQKFQGLRAVFAAKDRAAQLAVVFFSLAAIFATATPSFAQAPPAKTEKVTNKEKKQKPISAPKLDSSSPAGASAKSASGQAPGHAQALQAQNPLTPLYSVLNENDTNFRMGPLHKTQNVLLVEPIIPIKLTPNYNLITRWITPVIWQPRLAEPVGPFPGVGPEFGLGNIAPQFFFTPAHSGDGFVWGLGANAWFPTATDKVLGVNKWGGGPTAVALWIHGPLMTGVLISNTWAGNQNHGSSVTGDRINQLAVQPFIFYNLAQGWYVASLPVITADWTVDHNKWTVPIGGAIGRVMPVGNMLMNIRLDFYYNRLLDPAPGITNVGDWTMKFTMHFLLPTAKVPSLF